MEQLITTAFEHAKQLRQGANAADGYGARATVEDAERWERPPTAALNEARTPSR